MAETTPIKSSKDGTTIANFPTAIMQNNPSLGKRLFEYVRANGGSGKEVDFQSAMSGLQSGSSETQSGLALMQGAKDGTLPPVMPSDKPEEMPSDNPKTTFEGISSGIVKEAGPTALAGAAGFALGGPVGAGLGMAAVGVTNFLTPYISDFINKKIGSNQVGSKEAWKNLMNDLGAEDPDTAVEKMFEAGARGAAEAGQFIGGGSLASSGAGTIGTGTRMQEAGKVVSELPAKQIVGGATSAIGAESGEKLAGKANEFFGIEDPTGQAIVTAIGTLGGAMSGDLLGVKAVDTVAEVKKLMAANKMSVPEAAQEIIDLAKNRADVYTSDFTPTTRVGEDRRIIRETASKGVRDARYNVQRPQRQKMVTEIAQDYGVDADTTVLKKIEAVADDFWAKRDVEFTTASQNRDEVYDALDGINVPVDVSETKVLIDDLATKLIDSGDSDMQPFINKLTNWSEMIDNKTIAQVEGHRDTIGRLWKTEGAENFNTPKNQEAVKEIYRSLRKDMGEYVKQNGADGDFNKYEDSMAALAKLTDDFNTKGISEIMNNRDTPIISIQNALFNNEPEVVRSIYTKLTPEGQTNARAALVSKMMGESSDWTKLSPNAFAKELKKYGGQRGVLFSAEENTNLEAIKKVLDATARAETDRLAKDLIPGMDTPGVSRGIAAVILKHPIYGLGSLLGAKLTRGAILRELEKPKMRDLLLKYSSIPEPQRLSGTGEELLKRMGEVVRASVGTTENPEDQSLADKQQGTYRGERQ